MGVNCGPNIMNDGLILYLDSSNPKSYSGGSTWNDLITNKLFTGSNYYWANDISQITISVFLKKTASDNINYATHPVNKWNSGTSNASFVIYHFGNYLGNNQDGRLYFYTTTGNNGWVGQYAGTAQVGQIVHVCWTYNSVSGSQTWFNGKKTGNRSTFSGLIGINGTGPLTIYGPLESTPTIVYNVSFYNRELSDYEILQNYNALKSRFK